jgi:outer membrane receptor protein involved in Fe transport
LTLHRSARELRWSFYFSSRKRFSASKFPSGLYRFQSGLYSGPAAQEFNDSTNLKFMHKLAGFYAQDQWKVRPNLTLTLGLRYDLDFFPSAADVRVVGKMHPTNYGNVQPRVGLAYSFRQGKGVVRAGFGLFTGPFDYSDVMVSWQGASAFTSMNQPILPEFSDPNDQLVGLGVGGRRGSLPRYPGFSQLLADRHISQPRPAPAVPSGLRKAQIPESLCGTN